MNNVEKIPKLEDTSASEKKMELSQLKMKNLKEVKRAPRSENEKI